MNQDENDDDVKYITPTNDDDIQKNVEAHAYREHITSLLQLHNRKLRMDYWNFQCVY